MTARLTESKRRALRVAAASAALVAVVLAVVSLVVDVAVSHSTISHIDRRLSTALRSFSGTGFLPSPGGPPNVSDPEQQELSVPLVVWVLGADGTVVAQTSHAPPLPNGAAHVTEPTTVALTSTANFRLTGMSAAMPDGMFYVVIGQSLAITDASHDSLVTTELWLAPLLVILTGVGAFFVGIRTAAPIELSRQRQIAFAADASHELRTPLAVIEAETALATTRTRTKAELAATVERIATEAARLRHIVESLLWLARVDASPTPAHAEPVDMGEMAQAAAQRFQAVAERRGIALAVTVSAQPALVVATPEWADRLLGVLLDNACKYSPDGGHVRLGVEATAESVTLTIEDDGPGIAEDQRALIFDRFHRAVESESGAGLGLAIGHAIVTATRGRWDVGVSDLGGARISVTWRSA